MPTYRYRCTNGHEWETNQKITEEPLSKCIWPEPSGALSLCTGKVERVIQKTSFTLKGRGWAKDGYTKKI